jgi:hypothetical protein
MSAGEGCFLALVETRGFTMIRVFIIAACTLLVCASPARSDEQQPSAISLAAHTSVSLAGQARRAHLLGAVDLYEVGVYLQGATLQRAQLARPDMPKALRIDILAPDDLPLRLAHDWRPELIPQRLNAAATAHLRGVFAPLRHGDVVLVEYAPATGTVVKVNKAVVVPKAEHDLMLAFLDHWLGQRPLSEEMKRTLLGSE